MKYHHFFLQVFGQKSNSIQGVCWYSVKIANSIVLIIKAKKVDLSKTICLEFTISYVIKLPSRSKDLVSASLSKNAVSAFQILCKVLCFTLKDSSGN